MRITIDVDPQNGQSNVNTQSLAAAGQAAQSMAEQQAWPVEAPAPA
jgi:hypothetical protein